MPLRRVVVFGTPAFTVPTVEALLASPYQLVGVVTQPDRPRDRGQQVSEGPVRRLAASLDLPVLQPERLRDEQTLDGLRALEPDLAVVAAYGKILPEALLALPRYGFLNVHASLLPRWRGASPVQRAVMAGDLETGVSIMQVVRQLDAGPVYATARVPVGPDETAAEVETALARLGARLLVEVVDDLAAGRARAVAQDEGLATYAPRLTKEDGLIDWTRRAIDVHNQVRGLHPWPLACTRLDGRRFIVRRTARPAVGELAPSASDLAAPGQIVRAERTHLDVVAGDGHVVSILEIQPEGRRAMPVQAFLAGHHLRAGQVFGGTGR